MTKRLFQTILFGSLFIVSGCRKNNSLDKIPNNNNTDSLDKTTSYDFSYTGSQYLGGTLHFTTAAPESSVFLWNFGDSSTSVSSAPDHEYTLAGAFIVSLIINGDAANKISKTIYIGADSAHQALINGTRMWHKKKAGYYPPSQKDTVWYYNDVSIAVNSIKPGVISFGTDTLSYDLSTDSTIRFYYHSTGNYSSMSSRFIYNFLTDKMVYTHTYHVSAGAGDWTDTYTSF